jgi:flagellar FliL protein
MADDDDLALEEQETSGGKKKLIIIGAAALVLLLAAGGGVYWFFFMSAEPEVAEDGTELVEEGEEGGWFATGPGKAHYHKLMPKFTTTFEANSRQRYMQVEITLVTRDEEVLVELINHQPLIRNALVLLLANQDYLALQTLEGKNNLRVAANTAVQEILQREIGKPGIERVLFTDFVMQ